jgi:hypothetical protein
VIGLAFGAYDVLRSPDIFETQMQHFFGPNWSERITYDIHYFDEADPVIVYYVHDLNVTVFGFRGFSTGAHVALHLQYVILESFIPTLTDLVPFTN